MLALPCNRGESRRLGGRGPRESLHSGAGNIAPVVAEHTIDQRIRWFETGAWEWRFLAVAVRGGRHHAADI
jgi:hypothetical protein